MRNAYALVREHLGEAAVRYKRHYDLRVRPQQYAVGQWVLYFNPRRMQGKQEKWRRKYTGPFLVVKTIGPVNVLLQKSKRSRPFCVHIDKIKVFQKENPPQSWLDTEVTDADTAMNVNTSFDNNTVVYPNVETDAVAEAPLAPISETHPLCGPAGAVAVSCRTVVACLKIIHVV